MTGIFLTMFFVFGACIGSFLNVVILRLPAEEGLTGRSRCPACGRQLNWWELFPLLSFVFLGGKCSSCKAKISIRYFSVEFATAILFAACFIYLHPAGLAGYLMLAKFWLAVCVMVVVFVVDLEHFLILNRVVFPSALALGMLNLILDLVLHAHLFSAYSNFLGGLYAAVLAAAPFFLIWYFSRGKFMGFGDVKLVFLLGLLLGWPGVFVCLFAAIILGGISGGYLLLTTDKTLKSQLPFGTFLSLAAIFSLFFGEKLLRWYLSFLGF